MVIKDGSLSGCYFNTTDVFDRFHFSDSPQIAYVGIRCKNQLRVYMAPYEGKSYVNVMSFVHIKGCQTNLFDWNSFGIATTMVILSIEANIYATNFQNNSVNSCLALKSLNVFRYFNIENESPNVLKLFSCSHVSAKMASMTLANMSLAELSNGFSTRFPNLQWLNLERNKLAVPPTIFPWSNKEKTFANNISASQYIVNSRSVFKLDIPAHIFSREFILDYNNMNNLTEYTFHGYLHRISLKYNGMKAIGARVFQDTTGLQIINLRSNKLKCLPNNIFEKLTNLRYLDISENRLTALHWDVFVNLVVLQSLNLANNSLEILPKGLLTNLNQLKILKMQHNCISKLNVQLFPFSLNALTYVYFNNNPLQRLPAFIFWIKNLVKADFSNTDISCNNLTNFIKNMDENRLEGNYLYPRNTSNSDLVYVPFVKKVIDLSYSKIDSLYIEELTPKMIHILELLSQFKLVLKDNPINCDCKILPLTTILDALKDNGTIDSNEYFFKNGIANILKNYGTEKFSV